MPRKKAEKLSEEAIDKLYIVATGFNIPDPASEGGELRFDPGTKEKPVFVEEKNFDPFTWKELRHAGAVVLFEKYESPEEKEKIIFEKVEE